MVEIYRMGGKDHQEAVGYSIKKTEFGEVVDYITKRYDDNTKLIRGLVLTGVELSRRPMKDVLEYLGYTREEFIQALGRHYNDTAVLDDVFGSTKGCEVSISLPERIVKPKRFSLFNKSNSFAESDVHVLVDGVDFSRVFDGFDYYEENTADETLRVVEKVLDKTEIIGEKININAFENNLMQEMTDIVNNFDFEA